MLSAPYHEAKREDGHDGQGKAVDRLCKILPRLAAASDIEALQATRALCKGLAGSGLDFHDLADAMRKLFEKPEAPRKATWVMMSATQRGRWLMKLAKAEFLTPDELQHVCDLADRHCLMPGNHNDEEAPFMNDLIRRWRAKYGE
jgi:hypothetical protein